MKANYSSSSVDKFPIPVLTTFPDKILDINWIFRNTCLYSLLHLENTGLSNTVIKTCICSLKGKLLYPIHSSLQESWVLPISFLFSLLHKHPASVPQFNRLLIYFPYTSSSYFPEKYFAHQTEMSPLAALALGDFFPPLPYLKPEGCKAYLWRTRWGLLTSADKPIQQQTPVHHCFGTSLEAEQCTRTLERWKHHSTEDCTGNVSNQSEQVKTYILPVFPDTQTRIPWAPLHVKINFCNHTCRAVCKGFKAEAFTQV